MDALLEHTIAAAEIGLIVVELVNVANLLGDRQLDEARSSHVRHSKFGNRHVLPSGLLRDRNAVRARLVLEGRVQCTSAVDSSPWYSSYCWSSYWCRTQTLGVVCSVGDGFTENGVVMLNVSNRALTIPACARMSGRARSIAAVQSWLVRRRLLHGLILTVSAVVVTVAAMG